MQRFLPIAVVLFILISYGDGFAQVVTKPTQIGININNPDPNVSLHIKDNFESIRLDGTSPFLSFYDGTDYRGYLYMTGNSMFLYNRKQGGLYLGTSNATRLLINSNGDVGLGTISPQTRLHVAEGSLPGGLFNANTIGGFMRSSGNAYLSILTNSSFESGLLFGDQLVAEQGAIIYNNGGTSEGFQFRVNGNQTKLTLDSQGDLGIGKLSPLRPIHVKSRNGGDEYGILLERSGSSTTWEMSVFEGNFNWFYNGNASPVSRIETDGTYNSSDRRLKKNFNPYREVLPLMDDFQVYTYQMKDHPDPDQISMGLVAQEIVDIFPEMVRFRPNREGEHYYALDYGKTGVIALKAIQELQHELAQRDERQEELAREVRTLQATNQQLADRLAALEDQLAQNASLGEPSQPVFLGTESGEEAPAIWVGQNQPNPFGGITRIPYYLPVSVQQASMFVHSPNGQLLQEVPITGRGSGMLEVHTGSLPAGVYTYTLHCDGQALSKKQMVIQTRQ